MILAYLALLILVVYGFMLIVPKGYLFHELGQLPIYLFQVKKVPLDGLTSKKYKFGTHRRQYFLLYESEKTKDTEKPVVVYFHGGGWTFGSPEQFAANAKFFTDLGYSVIMPSYRRLPFYRYQAITEDRMKKKKKIDEVLEEQQFKNRKIIVGGLSAGANVAALLYFDKERLEKIGFAPSRFLGVMLHGAPVDLSRMVPTPILYGYAGLPKSATFKRANPISYLQAKENIPILIIHGTHDGLVSYKCADSFRIRCEELRFEQLSFHTLPNGTHLDSGRWAFEKGKSAKIIRKWLDTITV
ncbi:MAG: alpha/beta hydrolase [Saprospiraceae bacterium]